MKIFCFYMAVILFTKILEKCRITWYNIIIKNEEATMSKTKTIESDEKTKEISATSVEKSATPEKKPSPTAENSVPLISKYRGAIMGFAAILILYFHEWIILSPTDQTVIGRIERFVKVTGFCGVDIFLLLSGLGLTYSIKKTSLGKFYYNRFKRLIFPFLCVGIIRLFMQKWDMLTFIGNITGYNFYTKSMYSFLWFVPAIATFYLLFPAYNALINKSSNKLLFTAGALQLWLLISLFVRDDMRNDLYGFTNRIPVFLVGILIGYLCQSGKLKFTKTTWVYLIISLLLGIYLGYLTNYKGMYILVPISNCCIPNLLIAISLPFIMAKILDILCTTDYLKTFGNGLNKFLSFFGGISLEFYCIQEWLGGHLKPMLYEKFAPVTINIIMFICVTVLAFIISIAGKYLWKLVDKLVFRKSAKAK